MLIQDSLFDAPDFKLVVKYIEEENLNAFQRQEAYRNKKREQKEKLRREIEANFAESKARYHGMKKSFYTRWAGVAFVKGCFFF